MTIAKAEEDYIRGMMYARERMVRELLVHYDSNLSPHQRAVLRDFLGLEENSSQQPRLPDKDAPNYI